MKQNHSLVPFADAFDFVLLVVVDAVAVGVTQTRIARRFWLYIFVNSSQPFHILGAHWLDLFFGQQKCVLPGVPQFDSVGKHDSGKMRPVIRTAGSDVKFRCAFSEPVQMSRRVLLSN